MTDTLIAPELADLIRPQTFIADIAALDGEVFRAVKSRKTFRFVHRDKRYFAKLHLGVGWGEIIKNLVQFRLPVLGASNEWQAIKRLETLGVETMTVAAYHKEGLNPATQKSCIVTKALEDTLSLEDVVLQERLVWQQKRRLVCKIAQVSWVIHENGINHRDYYICHFHIPIEQIGIQDEPTLFLIDLHRAQVRDSATPQRWREKDLGGMLFSAADAGITQRDLIRFLKLYSEHGSVREELKRNGLFWQGVLQRAAKLYRSDHGRPSQFLETLVSKL